MIWKKETNLKLQGIMNIKKRIHKFTKVVFEVANCVGNPVYKVVIYSNILVGEVFCSMY